jgi:outer membrane lipoprotein-sorting protein
VVVQRALALATLIAFGLAGGNSLSARGDLFDELYRRGQQQNGDLRTFMASFTETTTSSLLTRPLTARGIVAVERPNHVALRYTAPDERTILIEGDRMTVSWPSRGVKESKDVGAAQRRVQKYFVETSPSELRKHFDISAAESRDRPGYIVTLVPKRKQIKEGVTRLELWIDQATLLMSAMRMSFPNGDTKTMTYTDVKLNAPIDRTMFRGEAPGPQP